jgi:NAD(P)-dependent dehydrogenase (short-subunit alcohol dehydrogenase family)
VAVAFDLSGSSAVVTGGGKGIGKAIAQHLTRAGARVWVWDIAPDPSDLTRSVAVDVTKPHQIAAALAQTLTQTPEIDVLVNDAGYLGGYGPFERLQRDAWRYIIDVNLIGTIEVTRQLLPYLRRSRRGRIVTMDSLAGKEGLANMAAYSAASAGVIAFTKALAKELADTAVRVNCVAPGPIDTELITRLGPEVVAGMVAASPLKRLGAVDEVAQLVVWLCSDACSFNTGAVFDMSGGRATY